MFYIIFINREDAKHVIEATPRKMVRNVGDMLISLKEIFEVSKDEKYMLEIHNDAKVATTKNNSKHNTVIQISHEL